MIADHTRRRWLVGSLGEVAYFPGTGDTAVRQTAVMGMGRVATFSRGSAVVRFESMLSEVLDLQDVTSVVVVAIGAGARNLRVEQVPDSLVRGFTAALATADLADRPLQQVTITEIDRLTRAASSGAGPQRRKGRRGGRRAAGPAPGSLLGADAAAVMGLRSLLSRMREDPDDETATQRSWRGRRRSSTRPSGRACACCASTAVSWPVSRSRTSTTAPARTTDRSRPRGCRSGARPAA